MLTVEGLTKRFGSRRVLADVSFTVRAGEVLGLIGPNGAGKTTVLECLAGPLPASSGTFKFHPYYPWLIMWLRLVVVVPF